MDKYSLNACWGARRERVEECARHLLDYLMCLGQWDESCRIWYEKANSLEEALQHKVMLNLALLERLLLSGRQYTDALPYRRVGLQCKHLERTRH